MEENERDSKTDFMMKVEGNEGKSESREVEVGSEREAAVSGFTDGIASEGTPYRIAIATGSGTTSGISPPKVKVNAFYSKERRPMMAMITMMMMMIIVMMMMMMMIKMRVKMMMMMMMMMRVEMMMMMMMMEMRVMMMMRMNINMTRQAIFTYARIRNVVRT